MIVELNGVKRAFLLGVQRGKTGVQYRKKLALAFEG
jgi:hypothetical protein